MISVLAQHVEEAAFLWLLRDLAVWAPHYDLKDVAKLDGRIEAHLDGLRIGGDAGWASVGEELGWEEPGEVFVATFLALEAASEERLEEALEVAVSSPVLARGAISALGWLPVERARPWIDRLIGSDEPATQAIGIGGAAVHRHDPGAALTGALDGPDALPRPRALKAAGELGRHDLLPRCRVHYGDEDGDARFWAGWSGALLGDADSTAVLTSVAVGDGAFAERAADLAARRMPLARSGAWREQLAAEEGHGRLAVLVARAAGDPAAVPWLLERMAADELARPAGEAFSFLTGLDLAFEDLEREAPEGFEAGPTESPEDEDVALDPDEDLPWPDPERIGRWWSENGGRFSAGSRYLRGAPMTESALVETLKSGRQRERHAAALELTLRSPGRPLFEVRARGDVQRRRLGG